MCLHNKLIQMISNFRYENDSTNQGWTTRTVSSSPDIDGAYAVFACDLDNDGDFDILSTSWYDKKVQWFENDGTGLSFTSHLITNSRYGPRSIEAADIDRDGDLDILAVFEEGVVAWYGIFSFF